MAYQERDKYSEQTIQRILYNEFKHMDYAMSNVYMFEISGTYWECDFFFLSPIRHMWEIEIKVDRQDFDRDFEYKKEKHDTFKTIYENGGLINEGVVIPNTFYFCAPEGVIPRESVPEYANLLEIYDGDKVRYVGSQTKIHDHVYDTCDLNTRLLLKFYNKCTRLENMLSDFRIKLYENPEEESEIVRKFVKRIRM